MAHPMQAARQTKRQSRWACFVAGSGEEQQQQCLLHGCKATMLPIAGRLVVQGTLASEPVSQGSAQQRQPAAPNGSAPLPVLQQPDAEAAAAGGASGMLQPSTASTPEQEGLPANGHGADAASLSSLTSEAAGMSDPAAEADTLAGSGRDPGSAAASDVASDSTAASTAANASSSKSSAAAAGMPDREDFQALSSVLKQVCCCCVGCGYYKQAVTTMSSAATHNMQLLTNRWLEANAKHAWQR